MTNVGWKGEYTQGDADSICMDGTYSIDELRLIIKTLERGDTIHWVPRMLAADHDYAPINLASEE